MMIPCPPAPERALGEYNGHPDSLWEAEPGSITGIQPQSDTNPDGEIPGIPIFTLTPATLGMLSGPQPTNGDPGIPALPGQ